MRRNEKLRALLRAVRNLEQKCELPLRRERRLGLIEQIDAAAAKIFLHEFQEALTVRMLMIMLRNAVDAAVCLLRRRDVIEAFRAQK